MAKTTSAFTLTLSVDHLASTGTAPAGLKAGSAGPGSRPPCARRTLPRLPNKAHAPGKVCCPRRPTGLCRMRTPDYHCLRTLLTPSTQVSRKTSRTARSHALPRQPLCNHPETARSDTAKKVCPSFELFILIRLWDYIRKYINRRLPITSGCRRCVTDQPAPATCATP